jgi:monofunctional biosynthetic peptidoglycan transglycosylase
MARGIGLGRGWLWKLVLGIFILLVPAPIILLLIFRVLPIPGTPEMLVSLIEGKGASYTWTDDISPRLERAVIGAEDQNFCTHHGFDWASINKAMQDHQRRPGKPMRGASTISQQTARTLFLVPMRSWIRKGLEAYLTVLVEGLWPKKRILDAYLNLVDWGDGIFGAEAAARRYFNKPASALTPPEAALLAAALPNPKIRNTGRPSALQRRLALRVQHRMARLGPYLDCVKRTG